LTFSGKKNESICPWSNKKHVAEEIKLLSLFLRMQLHETTKAI